MAVPTHSSWPTLLLFYASIYKSPTANLDKLADSSLWGLFVQPRERRGHLAWSGSSRCGRPAVAGCHPPTSACACCRTAPARTAPTATPLHTGLAQWQHRNSDQPRGNMATSNGKTQATEVCGTRDLPNCGKEIPGVVWRQLLEIIPE